MAPPRRPSPRPAASQPAGNGSAPAPEPPPSPWERVLRLIRPSKPPEDRRERSAGPRSEKDGLRANAPAADAAPIPRADESEALGRVSEKHESGGRGPGVINDYEKAAKGDKGGASYGMYQFASMMHKGTDKPKKQTSLQAYLEHSRFGGEFRDLAPATPEFAA